MAMEENSILVFTKKLKKLQEIMGDFPWEKDGINRYQSYKYITEKQYKTNFKKALKEVGLLWKMEQLEYQFIPEISDKMHLVICKFKGYLIDPETGEYEEYIFFGSGADNGDKALYKAVTGGLKYFLASNFNVAEDMEPENDRDEVAKIEPPATPEQREDIKNELINKDGPASKMQINSLKKILKQLREVDPNQEEFIAAIAQKTDNFTNITKNACEQLILKIGEMIEQANQETSS
jgi:hypothetical protein